MLPHQIRGFLGSWGNISIEGKPYPHCSACSNRIVGKYKEEGWEFVKYTGEQSHDSRQKSIEEFGDPNKDKKIMLASLKCGGLGLNLTMASRVICMDPWWNIGAWSLPPPKKFALERPPPTDALPLAIEQQAFCRVFRIGQTKETRMTVSTPWPLDGLGRKTPNARRAALRHREQHRCRHDGGQAEEAGRDR